MSLKKIIEDAEFKKILKPIIPTKEMFECNLGEGIAPFSKEYKLLTPNILSNMDDAKLVGIAFDYMARFTIAKYIDNNNKKSVLENMVCENMFEAIKDIKNVTDIRKRFDKHVKEVEKYIMGETDDCLYITIAVLEFAKFELISRTGLRHVGEILNIGEKRDLEIIGDLMANHDVFYKAFIEYGIVKKDSVVVFNPHFGVWSIRCFGADADIFIDGILYDFKCVSKNGYRSSDIRQICGYYLLHLLSQDDSLEENYEMIEAPNELNGMDIKGIALYKSRFGAIEKFDVSKINQEEIEPVLEQVKDFINDYYYNGLKFQALIGKNEE